MKDIWRILKTGSSLRLSYLLVGLMTILVSLSTVLMPLLSGWAINEIQKGSTASTSHAALLALAIFLLDLAQNFFSNWGGYIGDQISVKLNKLLSENYYAHLMSLPQKYFDTELSGKIISRLNRSIVQISNFIEMVTNNFLQFIFSTIFSLVVVFIISWPVGLMLLSLYPIFIWMTIKSSSTWQEYQVQKNNNFDLANGRFAEAITQVKVVKSYGQKKRELSFFSGHFSNVLRLNRPQSKFWHQQDFKRRLVLNIIFFGVYSFIFVRGVQGAFNAGQAVTLILYALNIRIPIFTISFLVESTQRSISDSRDYFTVMDVRPEVDRATKKLLVKKGQISFNNVSFHYVRGKDIIKNLDFKIQAGQKVALVGESGEGKTTLSNLILRLYDPQKGAILIDDQDINNVTKVSLRNQISVVFQEPNLFSGSIRENISYGNPRAKDSQVKRAAKAANAHEFINNLKDGYDTEIGEKGLKLSGGQKQRIAIARAILKDSPLLILDEATSSLDSRSELLVQEALKHLMKGRTSIIIAHRLSTIQDVDTIISMKGGKISEIGTPKELAESGGIYSQLLSVQTARSSEERQEALAKFGIVS